MTPYPHRDPPLSPPPNPPPNPPPAPQASLHRDPWQCQVVSPLRPRHAWRERSTLQLLVKLNSPYWALSLQQGQGQGQKGGHLHCCIGAVRVLQDHTHRTWEAVTVWCVPGARTCSHPYIQQSILSVALTCLSLHIHRHCPLSPSLLPHLLLLQWILHALPVPTPPLLSEKGP